MSFRSAIRWSTLCLALSALLCPAQNDPHAGYVYPAGGRQGTTFQATVGGHSFNHTTAAYVSGQGVSAKVLDEERQVTPAEQKELTETLSKIQEKRKAGQPVSSAEARQAEDIKQKLTRFGRRLTNPGLSEFVTLQITIASNAPPGDRELRLLTQFGLSNPLLFNVGSLPESTKADWKDVPKGRDSMDPALDAKPPEKTVALPLTLNGQIPPGGSDRYRFAAREGQRLVVAVRGRELVPYIPDAVPGWLQAKISLCDAQGKALAGEGDFRLRPDPTLCYRIPTNGQYVLEIHDSLYRGREDFVYRITVAEAPLVTGIFPLGGRLGTQTTVTLTGWNLPTNRVVLDLQNKLPGLLRPLDFSRQPFALDTLPEIPAPATNHTRENAQAVTLPVIVNGRINAPGEANFFRFEGKAGDQVVTEVLARRLDSPLDSILRLTDADGKQLAFNDDFQDKGAGLDTHHADSYMRFTLLGTGTYYLQIADTQRAGGPNFSYRLRLSAPRPDFELRVSPASLNVRGGASVPLTVHALRKDGFNGPIALTLKNAPKNFTLSCAEIPEGQDRARFTLNAPADTLEPFTLRLEGRALVQGREVLRPAVPADDVMQAFSYRHLVPAQELKVAVIGRFRPGDTATIFSPLPLKLPPGGTAKLRFHLPTGPMIKQVDFALTDAPEGIALAQATSRELTFQAAPSLKPGAKGVLIIRATADAPQNTPASANRRLSLGSLPAIPFEIVRK